MGASPSGRARRVKARARVLKGKSKVRRHFFEQVKSKEACLYFTLLTIFPEGLHAGREGRSIQEGTKTTPPLPLEGGGRILYFRFYGTELTNKGLNNLFIFNRLC
ncbi:hypothetical protein P167DRAFT_246002 [Morchella conica CCBAS932]|uniref:Uncharacterized protein n=1 Tax=Morchella conica CCBAS932 TaxID=1392247 RepID=A0A3N4KD19_9PEZI|nr:hypothetical protein P167DRAFT_246002 [Morchella conica CCBAS932]